MRGASIRTRRSYLLKLFFALLACGLLLSFSLHIAQPNHVHPGGHTQQSSTHSNGGTDFTAFSEYLHGTEKKLFIFTLLGFLLLGAGIYGGTIHRLWMYLLIFFKKLLAEKRSASLFRFFDIYVQLFSSGVLNTKAY
jgi:hypothetical protein